MRVCDAPSSAAVNSALGCLPLCSHPFLVKIAPPYPLLPFPPPSPPPMSALRDPGSGAFPRPSHTSLQIPLPPPAGLGHLLLLLVSTSPGVEAADWHQLEVVIEAEHNQLHNLSDSGFNYTTIASYSRDICKDPQPKAPGSRLLLRPPTVDPSLHTH